MRMMHPTHPTNVHPFDAREDTWKESQNLCQAKVYMEFCQTQLCAFAQQSAKTLLGCCSMWELCLLMAKQDPTMLLQQFKADGWDSIRGTDLGCLCHTAQGRVAAPLTAERLLRQRSERRVRVGSAYWCLVGSAGSLLENRSVQPCR